jgi:hypothetical protein
MKVAEMVPKPREQRDSRTGEVIPPCIGRKHWWCYVRPMVLMCKHCGAVKLVDR